MTDLRDRVDQKENPGEIKKQNKNLMFAIDIFFTDLILLFIPVYLNRPGRGFHYQNPEIPKCSRRSCNFLLSPQFAQQNSE